LPGPYADLLRQPVRLARPKRYLVADKLGYRRIAAEVAYVSGHGDRAASVELTMPGKGRVEVR
jgi:hypothetical protein